MDDGHCGLPVAELTPLAEKLLDVPQELIRTALDLELADGTVIADRLADTDCVFLAGLHRAERAIADRLLCPERGPASLALDRSREGDPLDRAAHRLDARRQSESGRRNGVASKVLVITGGPGVGKTTIVNAILRILSAEGVRL